MSDSNSQVVISAGNDDDMIAVNAIYQSLGVIDSCSHPLRPRSK